MSRVTHDFILTGPFFPYVRFSLYFSSILRHLYLLHFHSQWLGICVCHSIHKLWDLKGRGSLSLTVVSAVFRGHAFFLSFFLSFCAFNLTSVEWYLKWAYGPHYCHRPSRCNSCWESQSVKVKTLAFDSQSSGQSYKHFTIVNYDSRVVIWANL